MQQLRALPKKTRQEGWVVGLITGDRMFVKAKTYYQDETSLFFHNGEGPNFKDLVLQIEKINMVWLMPNDETIPVLVEGPATGEAADESDD